MNEYGQVLDILLQEHRDTDAAERFFRALLGHADAPPEQIVTDRLAVMVRPYSASLISSALVVTSSRQTSTAPDEGALSVLG